MYDNGYIVKCRSILTNDICLSEASHKADVFLVCISYLTYSLKKCINNLAVWKIRVNTHTHTHTIIARQYIIKHYLLAELNYRYRRLVRTNFMDFAYFCRHGTTR